MRRAAGSSPAALRCSNCIMTSRSQSSGVLPALRRLRLVRPTSQPVLVDSSAAIAGGALIGILIILVVVLGTAPTEGTLELQADGSFVYTPDADFTGPDTFTYHANDGAADSNIATVTITVTPRKEPPVANGAIPAVNLLLLD